MKKNLYLIILLAFVFISCEEVYVNDDNVFCSIDKNQYLVNEPVKVSIYGSFDIKDKVSWIRIGLALYDSDDVYAEVKMDVLTEKDSTYRNDSNSYLYDFFWSDDSETLCTNFEDEVIISIPKAGIYRLNVVLETESEIRIYGSTRMFDNYLTVK
ncbi:MAG: hypothetical protein K5866_01480 [Treponema sp.]|nr:hypothetical protein [Treponema sp.]